jgi:hypothetical protein
MKVPHLFKIEELIWWTRENSGQKPNGSYGPIRPLPLYGIGLRRRLKLAWRVFKGEVDVVEWER